MRNKAWNPPTFYPHRKQHKPNHIDYCFASADRLNIIKNFSIGIYADWIGYSDHVPVMVEIGK